jgi:hypothetical protein
MEDMDPCGYGQVIRLYKSLSTLADSPTIIGWESKYDFSLSDRRACTCALPYQQSSTTKIIIKY